MSNKTTNTKMREAIDAIPKPVLNFVTEMVKADERAWIEHIIENAPGGLGINWRDYMLAAIRGGEDDAG